MKAVISTKVEKVSIRVGRLEERKAFRGANMGEKKKKDRY